jgi:hypothetical protein
MRMLECPAMQAIIKLGLSTAARLEAAEREITHAALILLHESPISPSYGQRRNHQTRSC